MCTGTHGQRHQQKGREREREVDRWPAFEVYSAGCDTSARLHTAAVDDPLLSPHFLCPVSTAVQLSRTSYEISGARASSACNLPRSPSGDPSRSLPLINSLHDTKKRCFKFTDNAVFFLFSRTILFYCI